jgi:2-polyprenyl-6-hydroxyphenyl methylase/3-demethylubiquinone-9 3-methyltransferase
MIAKNTICLWHECDVLTDAINDRDRPAAKRAFNVMMTLPKIDVAAIEQAWRG